MVTFCHLMFFGYVLPPELGYNHLEEGVGCIYILPTLYLYHLRQCPKPQVSKKYLLITIWHILNYKRENYVIHVKQY